MGADRHRAKGRQRSPSHDEAGSSNSRTQEGQAHADTIEDAACGTCRSNPVLRLRHAPRRRCRKRRARQRRAERHGPDVRNASRNDGRQDSRRAACRRGGACALEARHRERREGEPSPEDDGSALPGGRVEALGTVRRPRAARHPGCQAARRRRGPRATAPLPSASRCSDRWPFRLSTCGAGPLSPVGCVGLRGVRGLRRLRGLRDSVEGAPVPAAVCLSRPELRKRQVVAQLP